jgi:hypothetical protein
MLCGSSSLLCAAACRRRRAAALWWQASSRAATRKSDIGDLISIGGSRELFHLAQTETLRVYVQVPQTQAEGIRSGQTAEVLIPELPNEPFPAIVVTNAEAMSATSRTLLTELQVDNSKDRIRIGSYAQVRFGSVAAAPTLTLPSSALIFRSEGLQVGVVDAQGVVDLRKVELGRDFGQRVEILSGVTAADKVIATPFDSLISGIDCPRRSVRQATVNGLISATTVALTAESRPACDISIPDHTALRSGTLTTILRLVATHKGVDKGMCLPRSDERVAARAFRARGRMRRIVSGRGGTLAQCGVVSSAHVEFTHALAIAF